MGDWFCGLIRIGWKVSPAEPLFLWHKKTWKVLEAQPTSGPTVVPRTAGEGSLSQTGLGCPHQEGPAGGKKDTLIDQAQILCQALCPALYIEFS